MGRVRGGGGRAVKRSFVSPVGVGVLSVITVLLVLTISLFAALAVSTAQADLALSQKNAETVAAYYAADAQAARLYAAFAAGDQPSLEAEIPITQRQSLILRLNREADGRVEVLEWRTHTSEIPAEDNLPVWNGEEGENG